MIHSETAWRIEMKAVITLHAGKPSAPGFYFTAADDEPIESILKTINEGLRQLQSEMRNRVLDMAPERDTRLDPVATATLSETLNEYDERRKGKGQE